MIFILVNKHFIFLKFLIFKILEQDSTEVFPIKLKVITSNGIDSLPLSEKGNLNV